MSLSHEAAEGAEFVLPDDIHDLIAHSLEPIALDNKPLSTRQFLVRGHPDLFVRQNVGDPVAVVQAATEASQELRQQYGLPVLPAHVAIHQAEAFVVTKYVDGRALDEVLGEGIDEEMLGNLDNIWMNLGEALADWKLGAQLFPMDILTPNQCMWGTLAGDTVPRIWLTDLPQNSTRLEGDDYAEEISMLANGIVEIENLCGRKLPSARQVCERLIAEATDLSDLGDRLVNVASVTLRDNITMYEE